MKAARQAHCVTVLLKPGVMDPVSQSVLTAANDLGIRPEAVATLRKYWLSGADDAGVKTLSTRLLANDAIEQVFLGRFRWSSSNWGGRISLSFARLRCASSTTLR